MKSIVKSANMFGFDIYNKINIEGNLAVSPISIFSALLMTCLGAREDTETEMAEVLNISRAFRSLSVLDATKELYVVLTNLMTNGRIEFTIANSIFAQYETDFQQEYIDTIRDVFGGDLHKVDFEYFADHARLAINEWVATKTKNRINNLLGRGSVDSSTLFVLVNALYLLANWEFQFNKEDTTKDVFLSGREKTPCMMMYQKGNYYIAENDQATIIELPYAGNGLSKLAMIIALPKTLAGLPELESGMTSETIEEWRLWMRQREVEVQIPRFTIDSLTPLMLSDKLQEMGMKKAFISGVANFSGILEKTATNISEVAHKTFIKVDETGTEMAAATAVVMTRSISRVMQFRADHPFFWAIVDRLSSVIVGMGRVVTPIE